MLFFVFASAVATAETPLVRWAQGRFQSRESVEAIETCLEEARKETLEASILWSVKWWGVV